MTNDPSNGHYLSHFGAFYKLALNFFFCFKKNVLTLYYEYLKKIITVK